MNKTAAKEGLVDLAVFTLLLFGTAWTVMLVLAFGGVSISYPLTLALLVSARFTYVFATWRTA